MITPRLFFVLAAALACLPVLATAQEDMAFMPDGGKTLLLETFLEEDLVNIVATKKTTKDWLIFLDKTPSELTKKQKQTLAEYLELNVPLTEGAFATDVKTGEVAMAFPSDGKELAIANCQFCHSFFTGYLMQDRDLQGWRNVFIPPFHKELEMSEFERETFSRYSAINMPLKFDEVPPELRF